MRSRFIPAAALAVACAIMFACGGITSPSNNVTDTFSGTIQPGGNGGLKAFNVPSTGEYTVKVTALGPNSSVVIGVDVYQDGSSGNCQSTQLYQRNTFVSLNVQALAGQIFSGHYCVLAYDVGGLSTATTYTMTVSHP
ncbi:MAG: hypothetical protein LAO77_07165 [Acidobacteriia bacterium]|nr:hypothetical protein [Terriglobia bacterium]